MKSYEFISKLGELMAELGKVEGISTKAKVKIVMALGKVASDIKSMTGEN